MDRNCCNNDGAIRCGFVDIEGYDSEELTTNLRILPLDIVWAWLVAREPFVADIPIGY